MPRSWPKKPIPLSGPQWEFATDPWSPVIAISAGWGAGKTHVLARALIARAEYNAQFAPDIWTGVVGATWGQNKLDIIPEFRRAFTEMGIPATDWHYHGTDHTFTVPRFGWNFQLFSGEEPDRILGATLGPVGINELAIQKPEVWPNVISRQRDGRAKCRQLLLAFKPQGKNWLYNKLIKDPIKGTKIIYSSSTDNPTSPPGFVDNMLHGVSARVVAEVRDGRFVDTQSGRAYYEFDSARNVIPGLVGNPLLPWRVALDFNVNPFIATLCQIDGDRVNCIEEIVMERADTREMARAIKARLFTGVSSDDQKRLANNIPVYPDASGGRETTSSQHETDFTILNDEGFWDLRHAPSNPRQYDRVNVHNGMLRNALNQTRLYYSDACVNNIADCEEVVWGKDGRLDKSDPLRTHAADGVGYMLWQEFPIGGRSHGGAVNV